MVSIKKLRTVIEKHKINRTVLAKRIGMGVNTFNNKLKERPVKEDDKPAGRKYYFTDEEKEAVVRELQNMGKELMGIA